MMGVAAAAFDPVVEATLLREYGHDPHATGSLGRTRVLLEDIRRRNDPESAVSWSAQEHLTASLIDAVNHLTWLYASAHSKTKPEKPKRVPRPGALRPAKMGWIDLARALKGGAS